MNKIGILVFIGIVQGVLPFSQGFVIGPADFGEGYTVAVSGADSASSSNVPRRPSTVVQSKDKVKQGISQRISLVKDSLFDDKYKPWGAASLPNNTQNPSNTVIVDKVDEDLFTPQSERHEYDQRAHHDTRMKVLYS